ncbi:hypothetical protein ACIHCX_16665 [Streptomyces sp. NPDC052043]|uniref:hypothetical protein n=1 Tax=Streptomyces sp. NPDC052043 TaxID=3365684 RepID=UPI0037CF9AD9
MTAAPRGRRRDWRVTAGPRATLADRQAARRAQQLLANELPLARKAAQAWSHGLAGLFVGLLGFSLVKGRTDVSNLATPYAVGVAVALVLSLPCGASGAYLLLRAAHGAPRLTRLPVSTGLLEADDHLETLRTVRASRWGIGLTLACGAAMVGAVGLTWYGPVQDDPSLLVRTPSGSFCGEKPRVAGGRLTLKTDTGEITLDLTKALSLTAVDTCPAAAGTGE